jgi:hypothetical protein
MAKLICGINEISNDMFNGKTIEDVIASAGPLLNLPDRSNLVILVNASDTSHAALMTKWNSSRPPVKRLSQAARALRTGAVWDDSHPPLSI